jgi:hypothetical protein
VSERFRLRRPTEKSRRSAVKTAPMFSGRCEGRGPRLRYADLQAAPSAERPKLTEKSFPGNAERTYRAATGRVGVNTFHRGAPLYLLPPPDRLNVPADLLELWAKVVVRGELDDEGLFVKWDEPTWERRREEPAARPAPIADFPFPGQVAIDRLHWLRQEYEAADDTARPRLARELLRRAEATGDPVEAARWRALSTPDSGPKGPSAPE